MQNSIADVEKSTSNLNQSLDDSKQALHSSIENVDSTHSIFNGISAKVTGIENVHNAIDSAVSESKQGVDEMLNHINNSRTSYSHVSNRISVINKSDTKKGTLFEDFANMIDQLPHLIKDK